VAATIQLVLACVFAAIALGLKGTIEDHLFSGDSTLYWCLFAAVLFYAASYFARGFLAGQRLFGLYGGLVMMESASRVVFGVLLVAGVLNGRNAAAVAIAAAPLLSLIVVPWALGSRVRTMAGAREQQSLHTSEVAGPLSGGPPQPAEPELSMARGLGFAGAVLVIM